MGFVAGFTATAGVLVVFGLAVFGLALFGLGPVFAPMFVAAAALDVCGAPCDEAGVAACGSVFTGAVVLAAVVLAIAAAVAGFGVGVVGFNEVDALTFEGSEGMLGFTLGAEACSGEDVAAAAPEDVGTAATVAAFAGVAVAGVAVTGVAPLGHSSTNRTPSAPVSTRGLRAATGAVRSKTIRVVASAGRPVRTALIKPLGPGNCRVLAGSTPVRSMTRRSG